MCFFVLFFHHRCFFLAEIFKKCFFVLFLGKNVLFSVEPPIFSGKHDCSEGFEHKEVNIFQNLLYCTNFLGKNFWPRFARHKVYFYM